MIYLRLFNNHSEYEEYVASQDYITPNVSGCKLEQDAHFDYGISVPVTGVTLDKASIELNDGETQTLVATVMPLNASTKTVVWSSSNDAVATVTNGVVSGVSSGSATITVTTVDGGFTAQCSATVVRDYSLEYFTIESLQDSNEIKMKRSGSTVDNSLQYSKDNGETWTSVNSGDTISVLPLDKVMWKGTVTPQASVGIGSFSGDTNVKYEVEGNAMSLLFGDDFIGQKSLSEKDYAFYGLFSGNTNVVSIENIALPATTLVDSCYRDMFNGCTSLTTAPSLPATTLAASCYQDMFNGCTSLNNITCLATDISSTSCTEYWTYNVSASGTFTKAASMSSWTTGTNGIPDGWTVVDAQ